MAGGRPSKYTKELLEQAQWYVDNWRETGEVVPTLAGMAIRCGVDKHTISRWRKDEKNKPEFCALCARVEQQQELLLISGGLTKSYDSGLAKLLLHKHGYSDKQEVELSGEIKPPNIIFGKQEKE